MITTILAELKGFPENPDMLLCSAYKILSEEVPSSSELCAEFINLLFSYMVERQTPVAYQIVSHWIAQPEISKYIFINQLFKDLPYPKGDTEISAYDIHILKVLSESQNKLTAEIMFLMMSYRLLETLLRRWSMGEEILYLSSALNLLKEDIAIQAVLLAIEENLDLFQLLSAKVTSPNTSSNLKLLYATFIENLFYNGDEVIYSLMFSGFAQTVRYLLENDNLLAFGLSCLECILEMHYLDDDIAVLMHENKFMPILNKRTVQYLYLPEVKNKGVDNNLVKCHISNDVGCFSMRKEFDLERFLGVCEVRLRDPVLRLDVLLLLRRELGRVGGGRRYTVGVMEELGLAEVLGEIVQGETHKYSREVAEGILGMMEVKGEEGEEGEDEI